MSHAPYRAARRYEMPAGYVDAVGAGEAGINWRPKVMPEIAEGKPATKSELVSEAANRSGLTKGEVGKAYDAIVAVMVEHLATGGKLRVDKFGTFTVLKTTLPVERSTVRLEKRIAQRKAASARKPDPVQFTPVAALRDAIREHEDF